MFPSPESALLWGLDMLEAMLTADWPPGFTEHELTEEVFNGEWAEVNQGGPDMFRGAAILVTGGNNACDRLQWCL